MHLKIQILGWLVYEETPLDFNNRKRDMLSINCLKIEEVIYSEELLRFRLIGIILGFVHIVLGVWRLT
jgi:hypothetical protein